LLEDSQIGDILFPAGATVDTDFDTTIYKLDYRYNFVADARTAIGASLGIHWMSLDFAMDGLNASLAEDFRFEAPLPLLGLHFSYALSPRWTLAASQEILRFDFGDYRGYVSDSRLTFEHDTFEHFGWGIGYNGFRLDGRFEDEHHKALAVEYGYQGLMIYLRGYF
jgi:hypothetical protein